jgi:hypothetical protein
LSDAKFLPKRLQFYHTGFWISSPKCIHIAFVFDTTYSRATSEPARAFGSRLESRFNKMAHRHLSHKAGILRLPLSSDRMQTRLKLRNSVVQVYESGSASHSAIIDNHELTLENAAFYASADSCKWEHSSCQCYKVLRSGCERKLRNPQYKHRIMLLYSILLAKASDCTSFFLLLIYFAKDCILAVSNFSLFCGST